MLGHILEVIDAFGLHMRLKTPLKEGGPILLLQSRSQEKGRGKQL